MLLPQFAVMGGDALAIVGISTGFQLIDQIWHLQRVRLAGSENQGFFVLIDEIHENRNAFFFTRLDLDDFVEVCF